MGMFRDTRDPNETGAQMQNERGGNFAMMKNGLAQANQELQQAQAEQELAEKLAHEGVDGTATIIQVRATGKNMNMWPELQFELSVDVAGCRSTVTHTQLVSPIAIGRLEPEAEVPIKVDPNDHSQLTIGLDE